MLTGGLEQWLTDLSLVKSEDLAGGLACLGR
jgi:hypothetical protein